MSKAAVEAGYRVAGPAGTNGLNSPLRTLAWALAASLALHALALTWLGPAFESATSRIDEAYTAIEARLMPPPQPPAPAEPPRDTAPVPAPPSILKDTTVEEPLRKQMPAPPPARRGAPPPQPAQPAADVAEAPLPRPAPEPLAPQDLGRTYQRLAETLLYPEEARRRGLQGEVVLLLDVGVGGRITGASVASSSGYAILDEAALRAVRLLGSLGPASAGKAILLPVRFALD